jgi:DNA modification methylase
MQHWPADQVERRPIAGLVPYARNARTHSEAQVAQIAGSIREWGWTTPVLVDEAGSIIAGHARILAAQALGLAEIPVMVARGWSEAQKRAYVLADNQLALNAGWDSDLLKIELADLQALDFNLDLIGFDDTALADILADRTEGLTDPDEVPETPEVPASVLGDVWLMGRHRLICGDATSADDVGRVLAGVAPLLMVTDPPYGVDYDPDWRNRSVKVEFAAKRATGKVQNDARADWSEAWRLFSGEVAYVWHSFRSDIAQLLEAGFEQRAEIIWVKQHFILGRGHYHWQHEPCWYAVRKGATGNWNGDRSQSTIWEIKSQIGWESSRPDNKDKATGHSTQKPVECMRRPIENNSSPGQAVYDPFVGSGTTIIAAETAGRACLAIELNPAYVDVAVTRWQAFTGETARLEATGETFAEIAAQRGREAA